MGAEMNKACVFGFSILLAAISSIALNSSTKIIPIPDSDNPSMWTNNDDGGKIEISAYGVKLKPGSAPLRLTFKSEGYDWGNAALPVNLPESAVSIEMDVNVLSAQQNSMLSIWLFEKDGDGHHVFVKPDKKMLYELESKWIHCSVPLTDFRYEPRGNKTPQILTTEKMLIGINSAKADICIANISFNCAESDSYNELNKTQDLKLTGETAKRIAILNDNYPSSPSSSNPETLAESLSGAGYNPVMLKSGDIADSNILNINNFSCIVFPYGSYFPAAAIDTIKEFLKSGGSFFSTGGYAFDTPCVINSDGIMESFELSITAKDIAEGKITKGFLNTRNGGYGDTLSLQPDQIGVFDPSYMLVNTTSMAGTGLGNIAPADFKITLQLEGYAASAMLGTNNPVFPDKWGRHIPLLMGYDEFGREKGPIGALAFNYAGPYAGSSWGFFGVANTDLFSKQNDSLLKYFPKIIDALLAKKYIHSLKTDLACYNNGESIKVTAAAVNNGYNDSIVSIRFTLSDRDGKTIGTKELTDINLQSNSTIPLSVDFDAVNFKSDLYKVTASLIIDEAAADEMTTGFAVYQNTANGFNMKYENNYFYDKATPYLLSGTNLTGHVFYAIDENPLVWDRDLRRMSENGLNIARILHFSPFVSNKPGVNSVQPLDLNIKQLPKNIERKLDAFIQLAQKHKIIVMLTAHDWMEIALTDDELTAQKNFLNLLAERYKNIPGFIIDIQNEPHVGLADGQSQTDIEVELWNDFLKQKYGSDEALAKSWKLSPPEDTINNIPYKKGTNNWTDMRTFDADYFRNLIVKRWIKANADGAHDANPEVPVTVGFLNEYRSLNKLRMMDDIEFANMHSYAPIEILRADFKLFDRRFQGKSISQGEFGSLGDHDKRNNGIDNPTQDYNRYLTTSHYLFGEGGSFIANWCWKDMNDVVFPWGLNYTSNGQPKNILKAYRNQSLLFRQTYPMYKPENVFLVVPIDSMTGGKSDRISNKLYNYVDSLFNRRVDFGVIDDEHLDMLPAAAKILVYPAAYHVNDKAYDSLLKFVQKGGILYASGDISYDAYRNPVLSDRMNELFGVKVVSRNGEPGDAEQTINVEPTSSTKNGEVYINKIANGEVYYTPDIDSGISGSLLNTIGSNREAILPVDDGHCFRISGADGSNTYVLINPKPNEITPYVEHSGIWGVSVKMHPYETGLVRFNNEESPIAVEFQNSAQIGGTKINSNGHFAILSLDGKAITESEELVILPFDAVSINMSWLENRANMDVRSFDIIDGDVSILSESKLGNSISTKGKSFDIHIAAKRGNLDKLQEKVIQLIKLQ
jgi:hypothetical protein